MKKRLLIVDDNMEFRTMLKSYLATQELPLEIFEAGTGEMGVTKASFVKPHVILMDISLPKANGLTAAREILGEYPDTKLIVLTMFEVDVFKQAAADLKAAAFVAKSDIYEKLVPAIQKSLDLTAV
ncbi:MAG: response regulator transcription factor [Candidatus Omnitrophica bacterium]|nr:response regulator transcription factor [Candidatus Omnitrophota bacterium]